LNFIVISDDGFFVFCPPSFDIPPATFPEKDKYDIGQNSVPGKMK